MSKPFKHTIRTRYSETAQDGIIHHSSYIVYLETARLEFFKAIGCDINELEKGKTFCPVVALSVKYVKPLYSLEDIVVSIAVGEFSKVRFTLEYEIWRGENLTTKGSVSHCFLNEKFKPIAIPTLLLAQLQKYQELGEERCSRVR